MREADIAMSDELWQLPFSSSAEPVNTSILLEA